MKTLEVTVNNSVTLLDSTGQPISPYQAPALPMIPQEVGRERKVARKDGITQALNNVQTVYDRELVMKTGYILSRAFPDYGWLVKVIGASAGPWVKDTKTRGVMICLAELAAVAGTSTGMYFNPDDFGTEFEFQEKVKQLGGELLERARLHRGKKLNQNPVTQLPDGFADVMPERKKRLKQVETVDEFVTLVKEHQRDLEQEKAMNGIDSRDIKDPE